MATRFPRVRTLFTKNRWLKTLALILAFITFYAIRSITNEVQTFQVPIIVDVADEPIAILAQDATLASVSARGSHEDLRRLDVGQIQVVVSPKGWHLTGRQQVPIGSRNVKGWLRGVHIIKVVPDILSVTFEREVEKRIAVAKPELVGEPRLGTAEVDFSPKSVSIRGPESKLAETKIVRTEPINVDGAVDSFRTRVRILSEGETWVYQVDPAEISARVSIVSETISEEWTNITVMALTHPQHRHDVRLVPPTVSVTVLGGPETVKRLDQRSIRAFVDGYDLVPGKKTTLPVKVHLPKGVNLDTAVEPASIVATLREIQPAPSMAVPPINAPTNRSATATHPDGGNGS